MAYINLKVDHSKFDAAASEIENYISLLKKKMANAQGEITTLSSQWQGTDSAQFKTQWDTVTNSDSTYSQMLKSLEAYANFLRSTASMYKEAQAKAVNRANNLPRW